MRIKGSRRRFIGGLAVSLAAAAVLPGVAHGSTDAPWPEVQLYNDILPQGALNGETIAALSAREGKAVVESHLDRKRWCGTYKVFSSEFLQSPAGQEKLAEITSKGDRKLVCVAPWFKNPHGKSVVWFALDIVRHPKPGE